VFFFPGEGVTIVGTTDVDHGDMLKTNPSISTAEVDYLLEGLNFAFPSLDMNKIDIQSTFSGIRAVVDTGKTDPSKESREHILWFENGLLTVSGGKLTTFRVMARQALNLLRKEFPGLQRSTPDDQVLETPDFDQFKINDLDGGEALRLSGRFGQDTNSFMESADKTELSPIESTFNLWAEIRWAVREEGIVHLDDLLLRRLRLGLILPNGGQSIMDRVRRIIQEELNWNDERWNDEINDYRTLIEKSYSVNVVNSL
jgi:glycerol-3-phosphate dehydrogenase